MAWSVVELRRLWRATRYLHLRRQTLLSKMDEQIGKNPIGDIHIRNNSIDTLLLPYRENRPLLGILETIVRLRLRAIPLLRQSTFLHNNDCRRYLLVHHHDEIRIEVARQSLFHGI